MDATVNPTDSGPSWSPSNVDALPIPGTDVALTRAAFPSSRIRPEEWEKHKNLIETMYASSHSMKDIKSFMELTHGFFASESQWKKKLSQWNLSRNLGKGVAKFVGKRALRRQNERQKKTQFRYRGVLQPADKIERHVRDLQKSIDNGGAPSPTEGEFITITPEGLSYCTIGSPRLDFVAPRTENNGDTPHTSVMHNIGPLKMAFYEGKGVDQWVSNAKQAASLVTGGRYTEAKTMLLNSLDGLEVLLGPDDPQTIDLLTYFVETAVSNKDFGEAANRLHKSHRNHSDNLGQTHVRTWQSLIRLGNLYRDRGQRSQAYHMFFNARQGLFATFKDDPEQTLNYTRSVSASIIDIHIAQDDFLAAEEEIRLAIDRTKAAGGVHELTILRLRHQLAHLYNKDRWNYLAAEGKIPYQRNDVESFLLEEISSFSERKHLGISFAMYLCSLEQLRIFYERTFQHDKLPALLTQIENSLTTSDLALYAVQSDEILQSMKGVALSYQTLHKNENAEWWLLYRQQQISKVPSVGSTSFEAVENQMQLAQLYSSQQRFDEKRQALKQAQLLARDALPADHEFHEYVESLLGDTRTDKVMCECCLVNEVKEHDSARTFQRIVERHPSATELEPLSEGEGDNEVE